MAALASRDQHPEMKAKTLEAIPVRARSECE
jgi:hypothetical protein